MSEAGSVSEAGFVKKARAMKIMAVSDRVVDRLYCSQLRQKYPDIDLLVGCGDLPLYYLEFLVSALEAPLLYVRGNHDLPPQYTFDGRVLTQVQGGFDVHGRVVEVEGLLIGGLEGSMRYRPDAPFMYTETEMRLEVARLLPALMFNRLLHGRCLDLLITHSPPFGIHDNQDLAHTGFKVFRTLMRLCRPRYLLHGHVHVYQPDVPRVTDFYQTTVINVYPYHVFDYVAT
jgi:uncharacterized protein